MIDTDEPLICINEGDGQCRGTVENHPSLAGTGMPIPRCPYHYDKAVEKDLEIQRNYPNSDIPPDWFDPTYAGETWNPDY